MILPAFISELSGFVLAGLIVVVTGLELLSILGEHPVKVNSTMKPDSFKPEEIMETSKNPGLNVRALHKRGIDGRGVGIAIIDQCLLTDHVEYKDQLRFYDEIHCLDDTATMHGAAVSSIAVGKTVGVAPSADLYYIAETHGTISDGEFEYDFTWLAKSVDRILEITESVEKAKTAGILVVSSSLEETFGLRFHGLGRDPLKNADDYHSYEPGMFWEKTSGRTGDDS